MKVNGKRSAFTLTEMLVVLLIVVMLFTLVIPALRGLIDSYLITHSGNRIAAMIERARMEAVTTQQVVAVRLIEGANPGEIASVGLMKIGFEDPVSPAVAPSIKATPLGRFFRLSEPVIISSPRSTAFGTGSGAETGNVVLPASYAGKTCHDFYILPNGSTTLNAMSPNPHLCVMTRVDATRADSQVQNPLVISIDPVTTRVTIYRK